MGDHPCNYPRRLPRPDLATVQRFMQKVAPLGTHWVWTGAYDAAGYGRFKVDSRRNHNCMAHRVAWAIFCGEVPDGATVDHDVARFDCPHKCVNPAHLRLMTVGENGADANRRRANGAGAPPTEEEVPF